MPIFPATGPEGNNAQAAIPSTTSVAPTCIHAYTSGGGLLNPRCAMLVQALMHSHLVDEYALPIQPRMPGSGWRMFAEGGLFSKLRVVDRKVATTRVIMAIHSMGRKIENRENGRPLKKQIGAIASTTQRGTIP
jgi:hypothetical protein